MSEINIYVKGISKEIVERLEKYCSENGITKKEAIERALRLLLLREHEDVQRSILKLILLKYAAKCTICNNVLPAGDWAYYDFYDKKAVCVSCFSKAHMELRDAKKIYELYKSIRRLKAMKTLAEQELNELLQKIDELERIERLSGFAAKLDEFIKALESYMMSVEHNKALEDISKELKNINEKIDEFLATHKLNVRKQLVTRIPTLSHRAPTT